MVERGKQCRARRSTLRPRVVFDPS
jgi:hypothetical protein